MAITQKDIAARAQVSRSLVARVLNNDKTIRVSSSKRQMILQTAHDLGYRPNVVASNLRRGKTHAVVAICESDANGPASPFMNGVLEVLAVELAQARYELKVRSFQNTADIAAAIDEIASASECDALVIWLTDRHGEQPGEAAHKRRIPFVIKGYFDKEHPDWYQLDYDHFTMMNVAVQHLADSGHTRIAYFGFDNDQNYVVDLLSGYKVAIREIIGTHAAENWIYTLDGDHHASEAVVKQWLKLPPDEQPTGIVIGAGIDAWVGTEIALAASGRRIGLGDGDVAVVGQRLGHLPLLYGHALAFVDIDAWRLAKMAAQILKQQLKGSDDIERITRLVPELAPVASLCLPLPKDATASHKS